MIKYNKKGLIGMIMILVLILLVIGGIVIYYSTSSPDVGENSLSINNDKIDGGSAGEVIDEDGLSAQAGQTVTGNAMDDIENAIRASLN